jgi:hypothetical protein
MKKINCFIIAVCMIAFSVSRVMAQDYSQITSQGGVEVTASYNPFGHNNLIVAFIKFVNTNSYAVNVEWTPLISCQGLPVKKGHGTPLTLKAEGSYVVTLWRSQACGQTKLQGVQVDMHVKKEGF